MTVEVAPAELVRPWWRRARLWFAGAAVIVIGAVLLAVLSDKPGTPLDPTSAHKNGSKALARLLGQYGAHVSSTRILATAVEHATDAAVVVTAPDDYSTEQLRALGAAASRLVLIAPDSAVEAAAGVRPTGATPEPEPHCADPGAVATGTVSFPGNTLTYAVGRTGATRCYAGALLTAPNFAVLGSADLLRNDHIASDGVAALDINTITDSRRIRSVVWLLPGGDAQGSGPASLWNLFPAAAYRAFWWLLFVAGVLAIWRARRLGAVVAEPLPVIVHAAELVEGHGRLYARAGARERAAAALRTAAVARCAHRLGLPRAATAEQVAVAAAPLVGRSPAELRAVLAGPPPTDDAELIRLRHDLHVVESALGGSAGRTTTR
jgi:hypothetical protein